MTTRLIRHLAFIALLALSPATSYAQDAASLRLRWEADPPAHGLQTVCGRVFNDGSVAARRVRLRVEGLDERGDVSGRRDGEVVGGIWPRSIGLFCISMMAGAASYRVTVTGADWVTEQAP